MVVVLHFLILLLWRKCVNRKYYKKYAAAEEVSRRAAKGGAAASQQVLHFKGLPPALVPPNLEISAFLIFCPGLVEASMAILGASFGGVGYAEEEELHVTLASFVLAFVAAFFALQLCRLVLFWHHHSRTLWKKSNKPSHHSEVTDAVLFLISRVYKPKARERGDFDLPPEKIREPERTEQILGQYLGCSCLSRGGLRELRTEPTASWQRLRTWLADSSGGSRNGVLYVYVQSLLQVFIAFNVGAFEYSKLPGHESLLSIQLALILTLIILAALWSSMGYAKDRLQGVVVSCAYLFEGLSLCVMFSAPTGQDAVDEAKNLANVAHGFMMSAVALPLALSIYDCTLAPAFVFIRHHDGTPAEIAWAITRALLLFPLEIANIFLGMCDSALEVATSMEATVQESVLAEKSSVQFEPSSGAAAPSSAQAANAPSAVPITCDTKQSAAPAGAEDIWVNFAELEA